MITNVAITKLHPHPHNPRKDLGDLTELAESIEAQGILQNLTVVQQEPGYCTSCGLYNGGIGKCTEGYDKDEKPPCSKWENNGGFTVVIGHRRLAAAKLAGLKELPCTIAEMDQRTQVATMLLENIQRSDLTVIEQAQGFQMMLDLGETAQTIAQKTGFLETTIRKRLFIASLDTKKSKGAYERGATLEDYMKLQQIANEKKRNKVLESLGTNNFNQNLRTAISEELRDRVAPQIIKQIKVFAKPTDKQSWELKGYGYHCQCSYEDFEKTGKLGIKLPKEWKPDEYLYYVSTTGISIYKQQESFNAEKKMSELPPEEQEKRREKRRKYKALKEAGEIAYQLRLDFVKSFSQKSALNIAQLEALSGLAFASVCLGGELRFDYYAILSEGQKIEESYRLDFMQKRNAMKIAESPASKILLLSLYSTFRDNAENTYFCGTEASPEKRGLHKKNDKLDAIYDCLCALGYQMSDDEQALRDGSHELFSGTNPDKTADTEPEDSCALCKSAHPSCDNCCAECDDHCNAGQVCRKQPDEAPEDDSDGE